MKKIMSGILAGILTAAISVPAFASGISIMIDGKTTNFSNKPFISENRVFVPMRDLFESIGANVSWNEETNCATATLGSNTISFEIGSNIVTENGAMHISDTACQLVNGKTFVPLRVILELLDFTVKWYDGDNKVEIETPPTLGSDESVNENENNNQNNPEDNKENTSSASEYELKVLELVNIERAKNGLFSLSWDADLANVARAHSKDMSNRNFFSHTNPDGKSPFDRLKAYGISYSSAAENIAAGQSTPEEVVSGWMNSSGHRANILSKSSTKLGVGYYKSNSGYKHYWTQCFTN